MAAERWPVMTEDEEVVLAPYGARAVAGEVEESVLECLAAEAESLQRLWVSRYARAYAKGRMDPSTPEYLRKETPEKMFRVPRIVEWLKGQPDVVVEMLAAGRVRARVQAAMGVGKTTLLAPRIAQQLSCRVLLVGLDAAQLQQTAVYVAASAIGRFSRQWSQQRAERVCCMTYADFNGYMATATRTKLFQAFDVLVFDEAFVNTPHVAAAKRCFAAYATPEVSLLLCSATISEEKSAKESQSRGQGMFREPSGPVSVRQAVEEGKLVDERLVDRTLALVATMEERELLREHYDEHGVDVRVVDDATSYDELLEVIAWLEGDSTTPRVLVADHSFSIGFNLPISYMLIWPAAQKTVFTGTATEVVDYAMSAEMVAQAKARTGRGLADGSGGVVFSPQRQSADDMDIGQVLETYTLLRAANILPKGPMWQPAHELFPDGLSAETARSALASGLPVALYVRFLGRDGLVARRFLRALNTFAQPDHYLLPSDDEEPVGLERWVDDTLPLPGVSKGYAQKVPVACTGELQLLVHAICAFAADKIEIPRWQVRRTIEYADGYDSDGDGRDSRYPEHVHALRRIQDRSVKALTAPQVVENRPWGYSDPRLHAPPGPERRSGIILESERLKEAMRELEAMTIDFRVTAAALPEREVQGELVNAIIVEGIGEVHSPGGSLLCELPARICEKMNTGRPLQGDELALVVQRASAEIARFSASTLFDCLAGPWESVLRSLHDDAVIRYIVRKGIYVQTYQLVDCLRARFSVEVPNILAQSHLFKRTFMRIFVRPPSVNKLMRAVREGKFDGVAQTSKFLDRVREIKNWIDMALLAAETHSVFLPTYITAAQRAMPLQAPSALGTVGRDLQPMPGRIANAVRMETSKQRLAKRFGEGDNNYRLEW